MKYNLYLAIGLMLSSIFLITQSNNLDLKRTIKIPNNINNWEIVNKYIENYNKEKKEEYNIGTVLVYLITIGLFSLSIYFFFRFFVNKSKAINLEKFWISTKWILTYYFYDERDREFSSYTFKWYFIVNNNKYIFKEKVLNPNKYLSDIIFRINDNFISSTKGKMTFSKFFSQNSEKSLWEKLNTKVYNRKDEINNQLKSWKLNIDVDIFYDKNNPKINTIKINM